MDIFIGILGVLATLLIAVGIGILNNRRLEIGAIVGIYPLLWGLGIGALTAVLFCIQHVSIHMGWAS